MDKLWGNCGSLCVKLVVSKTCKMDAKLIENGMTQTEVADKGGVTLSYVNRITKGWEQIANKTFEKRMDEFGYDVELTYKGQQRESNCLKQKWCRWSSNHHWERVIDMKSIVIMKVQMR